MTALRSFPIERRVEKRSELLEVLITQDNQQPSLWRNPSKGSETIPFGSTPTYMSAEALRTFPFHKGGDDIVHTRSNARTNVSDWSLVRIQPGEQILDFLRFLCYHI